MIGLKCVERVLVAVGRYCVDCVAKSKRDQNIESLCQLNGAWKWVYG